MRRLLLALLPLALSGAALAAGSGVRGPQVFTPTIHGVKAVSDVKGVLGLGRSVDIRVLFHRKVDLSLCGGGPTFTVNSLYYGMPGSWSDHEAYAYYLSGDDKQSIFFRYTVQDGETADDLDLENFYGWECVRDFASGLPMTADDAQAFRGMLAKSENIRVDGRRPSVYVQIARAEIDWEWGDGYHLPLPQVNGVSVVTPRSGDVVMTGGCEPGLATTITITGAGASRVVSLGNCDTGAFDMPLDLAGTPFDGSLVSVKIHAADDAGNEGVSTASVMKRDNSAPVVEASSVARVDGATSAPAALDRLVCAGSVYDPEGDPVWKEYQWVAGSVDQNGSLVSPAIIASSGSPEFTVPFYAAQMVLAGKHLGCRVVASDFEFMGAQATRGTPSAPVQVALGGTQLLMLSPTANSNPHKLLKVGGLTLIATDRSAAYGNNAVLKFDPATGGTSYAFTATGMARSELSPDGSKAYIKTASGIAMTDGTAAPVEIVTFGSFNNWRPFKSGILFGTTNDYSDRRIFFWSPESGKLDLGYPWEYNTHFYPLSASKMLFVARDRRDMSTNPNRWYLWATDGSAAGTERLALLNDTQLTGRVNTDFGMTFFNGKALVQSYSADMGQELLVTDGTAAGTSLLKDLNPGPSDSQALPYAAAAMDGRLYFGANDGQGMALFSTDGTSAGTQKVASLPSFAKHVMVRAVGSRVIFLLHNYDNPSQNFRELWASDGTTAGTQRIKTFQGVAYNFAGDFLDNYPITNGTVATANGRAFFQMSDSQYGSEVWESDGTAAGTRVHDLSPGSSFSTILGTDGRYVYLRGQAANMSGYELFRVDTLSP